MASVHRAGASWRAIWAIETEGGRRQKSRSFATRREALAFAQAQERAFEVRGVAAAANLTANQLADRFLDWCGSRGRQASTIAGYRRNLDLVLRHIGEMPLRRITPEHLDTVYTALLRNGGQDGGALHPRTVLHCHRVAHRVFGLAVKWRLISDNPCRLATAPSVPPVRARAPSIEQVAQLIAAARYEPWPTLLALAVSSGCRRGELLGLRWTDVDLEQGWLEVGQVAEQAGKIYRLRAVPKTKSSERRIALDPAICAVLRRWRTRLAETVMALGLRWEPAALVFPDLATGGVCTPRSPDGVSAMAGKIARRAGWPAGIAPLHGLRHRHASSLMHLPLRIVADRLGHSTTRITADLYQHSDDAAARAAGDAAGAAFGQVVRLAEQDPPGRIGGRKRNGRTTLVQQKPGTRGSVA